MTHHVERGMVASGTVMVQGASGFTALRPVTRAAGIVTEVISREHGVVDPLVRLRRKGYPEVVVRIDPAPLTEKLPKVP